MAAFPAGGFAGVLGGDDAVVLLDATGAELDRAAAPTAPTAVAVDANGTVWVGGRRSLEVRGYADQAGSLVPVATHSATRAGAIADLAAGPPGTLYIADELEHVVLALDTATGATSEVTRCRGPDRLAYVTGALVVSCHLDRSVVVQSLDRTGRVEIQHDSPILTAAGARTGDGTRLLALGGLEDAPLDRSDGGFGNIDSFLYLYRVVGGAAERLASINLSERDVVMPEAIDLAISGNELVVDVLAGGSGSAATVRLSTGGALAGVETRACPPGSVAAARSGSATLVANPLLDAWVAIDAQGGTTIETAPGADRVAADVRLGEALFSTTLIAPFNDSEGASSRFTCESCHYDGYSDGRTHWTGRDDKYATTRSVRGLFNNRPHFSRALDRTMTDMVDNEFSVVNKHSGRSSWFEVTTADVPWLELVRPGGEPASPLELRRALMTFLMTYTHDPNPTVAGRTRWTDTERRGAELFAAHCERCHAARLVADEPASRVPFDDWEALVMSAGGPIVWGSDAYQQTGVRPYLHPAGSRVPSLRRLHRKAPYFTNGSAESLDELLRRAQIDAPTTALFHDGDPGDATPSDADRAALIEFLRLL